MTHDMEKPDLNRLPRNEWLGTEYESDGRSILHGPHGPITWYKHTKRQSFGLAMKYAIGEDGHALTEDAFIGIQFFRYVHAESKLIVAHYVMERDIRAMFEILGLNAKLGTVNLNRPDQVFPLELMQRIALIKMNGRARNVADSPSDDKLRGTNEGGEFATLMDNYIWKKGGFKPALPIHDYNVDVPHVPVGQTAVDIMKSAGVSEDNAWGHIKPAARMTEEELKTLKETGWLTRQDANKLTMDSRPKGFSEHEMQVIQAMQESPREQFPHLHKLLDDEQAKMLESEIETVDDRKLMFKLNELIPLYKRNKTVSFAAARDKFVEMTHRRLFEHTVYRSVREYLMASTHNAVESYRENNLMYGQLVTVRDSKTLRKVTITMDDLYDSMAAYYTFVIQGIRP